MTGRGCDEANTWRPHNHGCACCGDRGEREGNPSQTGEVAVITKTIGIVRSGERDLAKKSKTKTVLKKNVMEVGAGRHSAWGPATMTC